MKDEVITEQSTSKSETKSYIDLGLPSGTLWCNQNEEGLYTHDDAVIRFGDALPTTEQWKELRNSCLWTWNGNGYKIVGLMEPPSFYLLRDATFVTEHWKEALVITGVPLLLSKTI
ncbi:MAG: hypothetical protein J5642_02135 [Bacteroidales bacterium]|nr:hypothetical protein [Bacteroidales bacterium]